MSYLPSGARVQPRRAVRYSHPTVHHHLLRGMVSIQTCMQTRTWSAFDSAVNFLGLAAVRFLLKSEQRSGWYRQLVFRCDRYKLDVGGPLSKPSKNKRHGAVTVHHILARKGLGLI